MAGDVQGMTGQERLRQVVDTEVFRTRMVREWGLAVNKKGHILPNLFNASTILKNHPSTRGMMWWDDFLGHVCTDWEGEGTWTADGGGRRWTDADDLGLTTWMQQTMGMHGLAKGTVCDAVMLVACGDRRHVLRDWLGGLVWDGVARIGSLFPDVFGAAESVYVQMAGRNFLVGMVARVMLPGCQLDTMPVLEGGQGIGKSSALRALAGPYYGSIHSSIMSKDFFLDLQGKWVIEIAEMDAFSRAETSRVKDVISTPTDRFRPPYARHSLDWPRQSVFAGTTNHDDWARDDTGGRRFWPIACGEIRVDLIHELREQYLAEAVAEFARSPRWWDMPKEETEAHQRDRLAEDPWLEAVHDYVNGMLSVTVPVVMEHGLKLPIERRGKSEQMRVASCLRVLGWLRETTRTSEKVTKRWKKAISVD